jgi:anion-transporting  ArsA/GET3 family ATPase
VPAPPRLSCLTEKRLLVVAGKGGVGKSTLAAVLGVAGARSGRRTLVVELSGRADVARVLGGEARPGLVEVELLPNLYHVTIDRQAALRYYLDHEVPGPLPVGRLTRSRVFSAFVEATPGMGELVSIGKVSELARVRRAPRGTRSYDQVVLDGPASGQLMALLGAPGTFRAIARVGPVARQTAEIESLLTDPSRTGVIAVATAEQMAVSEVLELRRDLDAQGIALDAVVVNKTVSSPFTRQDERRLEDAGDDFALGSARWFIERARIQRHQTGRLGRGLDGAARSRLPFVFGGIDRGAVEQLAARIRQGLG